VNDREMALQEAGDAAADCVQRLDRMKGWLGDLTPEEARAWSRARLACDFLYRAVNQGERFRDVIHGFDPDDDRP
jgi:hypothetical protein